MVFSKFEKLFCQAFEKALQSGFARLASNFQLFSHCFVQVCTCNRTLVLGKLAWNFLQLWADNFGFVVAVFCVRVANKSGIACAYNEKKYCTHISRGSYNWGNTMTTSTCTHSYIEHCCALLFQLISIFITFQYFNWLHHHHYYEYWVLKWWSCLPAARPYPMFDAVLFFCFSTIFPYPHS